MGESSRSDNETRRKGTIYMAVLQSNANCDDVSSDPLRNVVHFVEACVSVGKGTSDLVDKHSAR